MSQRSPLSFDVAVIGAGTAGLTAFRSARKHTDSVVLIEGGVGGTTCARQGCMPSKLLIAAAEANHGVQHAAFFGIEAQGRVDGRAVMGRVRRERDRFVGFVEEGVAAIPAENKLAGYARFVDDHTLDVGGQIVHAKRVVVATGSSPIVLPKLRDLGDRLLVSDQLFDWEDLPESVAVLGPGVIGLELGQALHRLGVRVRVLGVGGGLGPISDPEVSERAERAFRAEFALHTDHKLLSAERVGDRVRLQIELPEGPIDETFDYLLCAIGRAPNLDRLALENTSAPRDARGRPVVDPSTGRAGDSSLFFAGDVSAFRPLLHEATDEGRMAGVNAGAWPESHPVQRRTPLAIVFSDPQITRVGQGFNELDGPHVIGAVSFDDQGRSRVIGKNAGLLRIYVDPQTRTLLGAEGVGPQLEHLGHLLAWVHQSKLTVDEILELPFYHPVVEEGLRTALRDALNQLDRAP